MTIKISQMTVGGALVGTELLPMVQSGVNYSTTPTALQTYILHNVPAGTAASPAIRFASDSGIYFAGGGTTGISVLGVSAFTVGLSGVSVVGALGAGGNFSVGTTQFTVTASNGNTAVGGTLVVTGLSTFANGALAAPGIRLADLGTGFYRIGTDNWGWAANGTKRLDMGASGLVVTGASQATGTVNGASTTATAAGGAQAFSMGSAGIGIYWGSGGPTISAAKGSLYLRTDGSTTNDRAYINTNGTTGWTALTTAS